MSGVSLDVCENRLRTLDCVGGGRRTEEERPRQVPATLCDKPPMARPLSVDERTLVYLPSLLHAGGQMVDLRDAHPGGGEPRLVAELLEDRDRLLRDAEKLVSPSFRVDVEEHNGESEPRAQLDAPVARLGGEVDRLGDYVLGTCKLTEVEEGVAELGQKLEPRLVIGRQERCRTLE